MKRLSLLFIYFCLSFIGFGKVCVPKANSNATISVQHIAPNAYTLVLPDAGVSTQHRKHKIIAALLAMPLGVFGLHRMYLGTTAAVPFLYVSTFGGAFGILPFVDFVLIILCKDINAYTYNSKVFMWTHKNK